MVRYGVKIKGIIKNSNDEYLIVKKWYDDRIEDPYQWEFIDCELEEGQRPERQCAAAVLEATGIDIASLSLAYSWIYKLGDDNYLGLAFICTAADDIVILSEDLYEYKWVTTEQLTDYITNRSLLKDLEAAKII